MNSVCRPAALSLLLCEYVHACLHAHVSRGGGVCALRRQKQKSRVKHRPGFVTLALTRGNGFATVRRCCIKRKHLQLCRAPVPVQSVTWPPEQSGEAAADRL